MGRNNRNVWAFSGSRHGMLLAQVGTLAAFLWPLSQVKRAEFHQGGCVGADALAAELCRNFGGIGVHTWPASDVDGKWRASGREDDVVHDAMPALARTRAYIDLCGRYYACVRDYAMVRRSGTWAGIRYACKLEKQGAVIFPNGQYLFLDELARRNFRYR
jgi:hypothetical protein